MKVTKKVYGDDLCDDEHTFVVLAKLQAQQCPRLLETNVSSMQSNFGG